MPGLSGALRAAPDTAARRALICDALAVRLALTVSGGARPDVASWSDAWVMAAVNAGSMVDPALATVPGSSRWVAAFREEEGLAALLAPWVSAVLDGPAPASASMAGAGPGAGPRSLVTALEATSVLAGTRGPVRAARERALLELPVLLSWMWRVAGAWWSWEVAALAARWGVRGVFDEAPLPVALATQAVAEVLR